MIKKPIIAILGILVFVSCGRQELNSVPTSVFGTLPTTTKPPSTSSTETAIPVVESSATPFPDKKSLRTITEDGKWEISLLLGYDSTIQVTSIDGKTKWVLDETTLPDVTLGQLWNYKTANDGKSLYFGLGSYQYEELVLKRYPPNYGLYKLNLANGEIKTLLAPHMGSFEYATYGYFALSPDESQIAYSWWDTPAIILRSIATIEEQTISLPGDYKIAGPFVWSPNGKSILFTMWTNAWDYPTDFQVARLDIDDKLIHSLYSDNEENSFFVPTEWVEDDVVYLLNRRTELWQINPITGELQKRMSTTP